MKQRKTFLKKTEADSLVEEVQQAPVEHSSPDYVSPQIRVYYVALENSMAAASVTTSTATPQVTDWTDVTTTTDDISLR